METGEDDYPPDPRAHRPFDKLRASPRDSRRDAALRFSTQCAGTASSVARPGGGTTTVDRLPSAVSF